MSIRTNICMYRASLIFDRDQPSTFVFDDFGSGGLDREANPMQLQWSSQIWLPSH